MTSKNLYFKLMAEDLKRRVWTIALTVLALIFAQIFPIAVKCSEFADSTQHWTDATRSRMASNIMELLKMNPMAAAVLMGAAVLWAITSFCYLHNSRKVDFYHSIPVKRHVLYVVNYVDGIWMTGVVYLLFTAVTISLAGSCGIDKREIAQAHIWSGAMLNVIFYSLIYTVTSAAMMLTGNIVVALLGSVVFFSYGPAVTALIRAYVLTWFHTYYETEATGALLEKLIRHTSPITAYVFALGNFEVDELELWGCIFALAVTLVLAVLIYLLYRVRPSESAGKAMAFAKTETAIKVLIVVPVGMVFGIFFYELRATLIWLLIGTAAGTILTHCLIEIIYRMDFRKLFDRKGCLAVCLGLTMLLSVAGYEEWFGYDSWIPDTSKIKSVSVDMSGYDDWVTYGKAVIPQDEFGSSREPYWDYQSGTDYTLNNMILNDIYPVMELVKEGVQTQKELRKNHGNVWDDVDESENTWSKMTVQYRLTNGKTAVRSYQIRMDQASKENWAQIYDSAEYKMGKYPLLSQTFQETAGVYFQQYNRIQKVEAGHQELEHLLEVYQSELKALTMEKRKTEYPLATIQFRTLNQSEGIRWWNSKKTEEERWYTDYLTERCYYPIYPSFTGTLSLLQKAGISLKELDTDTVSGIQITSYDADSKKNRTVLYSDEADFHILLPALTYQDYVWMNGAYERTMDTASSISVIFKDSSEKSKDDIESEDVELSETKNWYPFSIDPAKLTKEQRMKYLQEN